MTTKAEGELRDLHSRMPLLVRQSEFDAWLSSEDAGNALDQVLVGSNLQGLEVYRVSTAVKHARRPSGIHRSKRIVPARSPIDAPVARGVAPKSP